jgi:hypothetical protein
MAARLRSLPRAGPGGGQQHLDRGRLDQHYADAEEGSVSGSGSGGGKLPRGRHSRFPSSLWPGRVRLPRVAAPSALRFCRALFVFMVVSTMSSVWVALGLAGSNYRHTERVAAGSAFAPHADGDSPLAFSEFQDAQSRWPGWNFVVSALAGVHVAKIELGALESRALELDGRWLYRFELVDRSDAIHTFLFGPGSGPPMLLAPRNESAEGSHGDDDGRLSIRAQERVIVEPRAAQVWSRFMTAGSTVTFRCRASAPLSLSILQGRDAMHRWHREEKEQLSDSKTTAVSPETEMASGDAEEVAQTAEARANDEYYMVLENQHNDQVRADVVLEAKLQPFDTTRALSFFSGTSRVDLAFAWPTLEWPGSWRTRGTRSVVLTNTSPNESQVVLLAFSTRVRAYLISLLFIEAGWGASLWWSHIWSTTSSVTLRIFQSAR